MNAEFSECGTYRYILRRKIPQPIRWVKKAVFIMLNPSTADEVNNDPTIRRCIKFAEREGCTELLVVNLFALRSTDPKNLTKHEDPIGPLNDSRIDTLLLNYTLNRHPHIVVAAWGANPLARERGQELIKKWGPIYCLGKNKDGSPKHPLYVPSNQPLELFE